MTASPRELDESRKQIVDYFVPRVVASPPDAMRGQFLKFGEVEAGAWLERELVRVFPKADALIQKMQLDVRYKDVTFETLNREDFLDAIKEAFAHVDWDKAYKDFRAAGGEGMTAVSGGRRFSNAVMDAVVARKGDAQCQDEKGKSWPCGAAGFKGIAVLIPTLPT